MEKVNSLAIVRLKEKSGGLFGCLQTNTVMEIALRVPTKSLLCLKRTCKFLYKFLSNNNHEFVQPHLKCALKDPSYNFLGKPPHISSNHNIRKDFVNAFVPEKMN